MAVNYKVSVKFDGTNWTDVSQYVKDFDISEGRSYEFDEFETATLTVTFDNEDGRFTPGRLSSPYYPNVKPSRAIKVEAIDGVTTYALFMGQVERWPVTLDGKSSNVTITCYDALGSFSNAAIKRPMMEIVKAAKPQRYYPCSDGPDATLLGDFGTDNIPAQLVTNALGGACFAGGTSLYLAGEGENGGAVEIIGGTGPAHLQGGAIQIPFVESRRAGTFRMIFTWEVGTLAFEGDGSGSLDGVTKLLSEHSVLDTPGNHPMVYPIEILIRQESGNPVCEIKVEGIWPDGVGDTPLGFILAPDEKYVFDIQMTLGNTNGSARSGRFDMYRAGNPIPVFSYAPAAWGDKTGALGWSLEPQTKHFQLGGDMRFNTDPGSPNFEGGYNQSHRFSNVILGWNTEIMSLDVTKIVRAAGNSDSSDTEHVAILSSALGKTFTSLAPITGGQPLQFPNWSDEASPLELLKALSTNTAGACYAGHDGNIVYESRHYRLSKTPAATFSDNTGPTVEGGLLFEVDDQRLANDVTVDRSNGITLRALDQTSIDYYGRKSKTVQVELTTDEEPQYLAQWLVYLGKDALIRCDNVSINATAQPTHEGTLLGLKVSDKIKLADLPAQAPQSSIELFVEGITRTVKVEGETPELTMSLRLSPAEKHDAWVIEDPVYGFIDGPGVLVY